MRHILQSRYGKLRGSLVYKMSDDHGSNAVIYCDRQRIVQTSFEAHPASLFREHRG